LTGRFNKEQSLGEWAKAAAKVILTRRDDLVIVDTKDETGLDFHVQIDREEKSMRLIFGVLLRVVPSPVTPNHANKVLRPTMGQFQGMRKFTYPVCLFFLTMRDDQELFSWLAEPTLTDGVPKLVHHEVANCVPVTRELLDQFVEGIVAWYDAVEAVLIA
jgi:hypothetical protein